MIPAAYVSEPPVSSPWFYDLFFRHCFDLGAPIALRVFIAIIINNLDEAELERLREMEAVLVKNANRMLVAGSLLEHGIGLSSADGGSFIVWSGMSGRHG